MRFVLAFSLLLPAGAFAAPRTAPPTAPAAAPASAPVAPTIDPAFEADIRQLLAVTGSAALAKQMMTQMLPQLKQLAPSLPASFWTDFEASVDTNELIDLMVPVYARHLTDDDVKALVAFYQTPTGQKYISVSPAIAQDSMMVGRQWGESLAMRVLTKAQAAPAP